MQMMRMNQQYGQAMTEFNIVAAFVLVPVFILIPLVGKYIDIKHASVQSARYMAWERTVWYEQNTAPRDSAPPVKSAAIVRNETQNRIFGQATDTIDSRLDRSALKDSNLNLLWTDNAGNQLVDAGNVDSDYTQTNADTPSTIYTGFETFTTSIDTIPNKLASYLPFNVPRSDITSKFNYDGLYETDIKVAVNNISGLETFDNLNLVMTNNRAAILTDTWKAQDQDQFSEWSEDFVAANALGLSRALSPVQQLFGETLGVLGTPEIARNRLRIGEVNTDPVPDSSQEPDCPKGICSY